MRLSRAVIAAVAVWLLALLLPGASPRWIARAAELGCLGSDLSNTDVLMCDDFEDGTFLEQWVIGSTRNRWPSSQFVLCGDGFGFEDRCAAWSHHLAFDGSWGFWGFDALKTFPPHPEFYVRWYQYISDPYTWGTLEDKSVILQDSTRTLTAYVGTSRNHLPVEPHSGPGVPFVANYQDVDWPETGGQHTKVNRFQNQGNDIMLQPGRWYLFEWYIRLNTPGMSDGVTKLWIDDATEPIATQTLRIHHTDMRWLRSSDTDKQFTTVRLTVYNQRCDIAPSNCPPNGPHILNQSHRWDRIVVSKAPIGPVRPPTVAVSSPLHNAIVSGTIPVTAGALDADIVGVQFQLDGAPLGTEDTATPYSVQWDTTTVADGPHTLTAHARDSTGTITTSNRVTVAVANVATVKRVEETGTGVTYEADTWIWGNRQRMWSGDTAALAFATGQGVTLIFKGTGVSWIGFRGPQTGIANVYLDGDLVAIVDAYAPIEEVGAALFTASGLAPGPHALAIEVPTPRAKHRLSNDYFTVVDAFDIIGVDSVPDATGTARLEETSTTITYAGTWIPGNTARSWSGGTAALGFAAGQQSILRFIGTTVSWIGFRGPQTGIANVYLDGSLVATVDTYAATEEVEAVLFSANGLTSTLHTLAIEATGMKNASSTDRFVVVDAFDVY